MPITTRGNCVKYYFFNDELFKILHETHLFIFILKYVFVFEVKIARAGQDCPGKVYIASNICNI